MSDLELTLAALRPRLKDLLPADLNARLDTEALIVDGSDEPVAALLDVRDTLYSLEHNLGTYLPRSLLLSHPRPGLPRSELLEGTVLFLDVTGFTPLTERLGAMGEEGAERLNRMINGLFTALLDPLTRLGGELLIFAGDALQAYFPAMNDAQDAVWAVRAALLMIRAIDPFDQGPTPLTASVGLARGSFLAAQVGTAQRMEYLVTGGPIQESMQAEERASPRQISLAPGLEILLSDHFHMNPFADGYHGVIDDLGEDLDHVELVSQPSPLRHREDENAGSDPVALTRTIGTILDDIAAMFPFFPPNVLRRIIAHQRERQFPGEHRLVAVMFVNLRGFEGLIETLGPERLPLLTFWINRYFVEAQETLAGCGGLVTHVDPYDKGFTLLCPFGAPLADEDTPHRATAAALRLNERLRALNHDLIEDLRQQAPPAVSFAAGDLETGDFPLTHHIGITYGPIFTGQVGWRERQEYVVVGDDVNLSARLMNKAKPNQILVSGWVHDRVRQSFECHPLEPMRLKGKAKAVPVFAVERRVPASAWLREAAIGPLVGRDGELTSLENALDALENGQGGVLVLVGETGMGKTRLIAELALRARYWRILLLAGRCLSYAQTNPYTPWIESLWRWFEADTAADANERRIRVSQTLEHLGVGYLAETFWTLLGLPQAEVDASTRPTVVRPHSRLDLYSVLQQRIAQAPAPQRDVHLTVAWRLAERDPTLAADLPSLWERLGQRTHPDQALLTLFQEIARHDQPVLFLVEDLQWVDRASWEPLLNLAKATARHPILLLITARLGQTEKRWRSELDEHTRVVRVVLQGLDWADTGKLAARLIMAREATPELVSWLHHRAQGNPLFSSQLLYALAGADGLSVDAETGRVTLNKTLPSLPLTVREIMLSRVDQLSEETRTVVKLASVIGDPITWDSFVHLAQEASVCDQAQLADCLKELSDRSLLHPEPPAIEFTFAHPLLQEAVYSSVPYAQRRRWHRIIADHMAQEAVETVHQHLVALAHHYNHSDTPKLGVRFNRLAGDQARVRQAWGEALDYYQVAIDIIGKDASLRNECILAVERRGDVFALTEQYIEAAAAYEVALAHEGLQADTPQSARLEGKLGLICPLLKRVDEANRRLMQAWDELDLHVPLRPWLAAALGWIALRAQPKDMAAVAGAGAAAVSWWQRAQRIALSETAQMALKEMMAGRVPPDYGRLVQLALGDSEEIETQ